jgi:hypothetical protein
VTDPERRERLVAVLVEAARAQEHAPGYAAELQIWTRRYAAGHDGVPAGNVPPPQVGATGGTPLRRFPRAGLAQPRQGTGHGEAGDAAALLVLTTPGDDPLDRLRAGEATSAVLLAATVAGLATTPLSQALEVSSTRAALAGKVLHVTEHPQIVLRIGNPASTAAELPATPRRDLRSVLIPS